MYQLVKLMCFQRPNPHTNTSKHCTQGEILGVIGSTFPVAVQTLYAWGLMLQECVSMGMGLASMLPLSPPSHTHVDCVHTRNNF